MKPDPCSGTDTLPLLRVVAVAVSSATDRQWQSNDMSWQCSDLGEHLDPETDRRLAELVDRDRRHQARRDRAADALYIGKET